MGSEPQGSPPGSTAAAEGAELHLAGGKGRAPEASTKQQIPPTAAAAGLDFLAREQLDLPLSPEVRDEQTFREKL